jgi:TRAP-type C4-dicarboxylate transport system substrate-binding protein
MNTARFNALSAEDRKVLEEGVAVWEAALAHEVRAAVDKGTAEARANNVAFTAASPADQARFDAIYLRDSESNARALSRFGIDGLAAFKAARSAVTGKDRISCGSQI